jgi:hypothetical protein
MSSPQGRKGAGGFQGCLVRVREDSALLACQELRCNGHTLLCPGCSGKDGSLAPSIWRPEPHGKPTRPSKTCAHHGAFRFLLLDFTSTVLFGISVLCQLCNPSRANCGLWLYMDQQQWFTHVLACCMAHFLKDVGRLVWISALSHCPVTTAALMMACWAHCILSSAVLSSGTTAHTQTFCTSRKT